MRSMKIGSSKIQAVDLSLLLVRIYAGGFMVFAHGWKKIDKLLEGGDGFPDPLGVGGLLSTGLTVFAEVVCALALVFGLLTRWASIPLIITMFVAAFIVHGNDGFGKQELPLIYMISYLVIFISGPGKYSLDRQLLKK